MNSARGLVPLLALCCSLLFGCVGTETGNPNPGQGGKAKLTLLAHSSNTEKVSVGADSAELGVASMWLSLERIELVRCNAAGESVVLLVDAAHDLASGSKPVSAEVPDLDYCGLRVALTVPKSLPVDAPTEFQAGTIWLQGTRRERSGFRILSTARTGLLLSNDNRPLELEPGLLLVFDLFVMLNGMDLNALSEANEVRVDASSHPELLSVFDQNLSSAITLHKDWNQNGALDPNELQPIARP